MNWETEQRGQLARLGPHAVAFAKMCFCLVNKQSLPQSSHHDTRSGLQTLRRRWDALALYTFFFPCSIAEYPLDVFHRAPLPVMLMLTFSIVGTFFLY